MRVDPDRIGPIAVVLATTGSVDEYTEALRALRAVALEHGNAWVADIAGRAITIGELQIAARDATDAGEARILSAAALTAAQRIPPDAPPKALLRALVLDERPNVAPTPPSAEA